MNRSYQQCDEKILFVCFKVSYQCWHRLCGVCSVCFTSHLETQPRNPTREFGYQQLHSNILFKMAAFLRGKQAGIQNDLSAGILPGLFAPDDQARFGINSQIGYEAPGTYEIPN
jgi:hypothetical protein